MTITIDLPPELERKLRATSAARGVPAEEIVVSALSDRLRRTPTLPDLALLSSEESAIFHDLKDDFSEEDWQRFNELIDRRKAEVLTDTERDELIAFTDRREAYTVKRLEKLVALARLRGISLDQVIDQFGLRPASYD